MYCTQYKLIAQFSNMLYNHVRNTFCPTILAYEQLKPADDICLIKLAGKIAYNDRIQPVCLPNINSSTNECYVTGWGDTKGK